MRIRVVSRLALILGVAALLAPVAAIAQTADPSERLGEVEEQIDDAQQQVETLGAQHGTQLGALEALNAEASALDAELVQLTTELSGAEAALLRAEEALATTARRLDETEARLGRTRSELHRRNDDLADRARDSYMYGGSNSMSALSFELADAATFSRGMKYAQAVLANDQTEIVLTENTEREVERTTIELGQLKRQRAAQEASAQSERDAVAGIVAERQQVLAQVQAKQAEREQFVAELEADRDNELARLDALAAESEQLETELAEIAAREAAEEAAARRAERRAAAREREAEVAEEDTGDDGGGDSDGGSESSAPPSAPDNGDSGFIMPTSGTITSGFGYRWGRLHAGIDIGAASGTPIYASKSGTVIFAGYNSGGYGNLVTLDHGDGYSTNYAHQTSVAVSSGQSVQQGQLIGYVGSTGFSTGPHLHFEIRVNGSPQDPMGYL